MLWLSKGQMDQRFRGPGPTETSQTDDGLSCSHPDVKVCEHGHQYWRQFHASLTLWLSNPLLILVDRDTAEGIPAISPSSWYFIRFFLSLFSLCHILKLQKKHTQVWNRHSWKKTEPYYLFMGAKQRGPRIQLRGSNHFPFGLLSGNRTGWCWEGQYSGAKQTYSLWMCLNSNTQTKQATLWTFDLHQVYS